MLCAVFRRAGRTEEEHTHHVQVLQHCVRSAVAMCILPLLAAGWYPYVSLLWVEGSRAGVVFVLVVIS